MSYKDTLDRLYAIVADTPRGVQPDLPFHTVEGVTEGEVVPVDELTGDVVRQFDIRETDGPQDDGAAGFVWTRFRVGLDLRVRYPATPRALSMTMGSDDIPRLVNAIQSPSNHIDSPIEVVIPGRPRVEELVGDGGSVIALLRVLPLTVIYTAL